MMRDITLKIFLLYSLLRPALMAHAASTSSGIAAQPIDAFDDVESQLTIYPTDYEETSGLQGNLLIYSDFCLETRDNLMGDLRRSTGQLATSVLSMFVKSVERLGLTSGSNLPPLAPVINDHEAQVRGASNGPMGEESVVTTAKPVAEAAPARGIFGSVMNALSTTRNVVTSGVQQTLNTIKSNMGLKTVSVALGDACNKVKYYETDMRKRFDETTRQLGGMAIVRLDNLKCMTTNRILNLNNFCKTVTGVHQYFQWS